MTFMSPLLLLACTGPTTKPSDGADSADTTTDTAESDTAVDETAESESGDSGDTWPTTEWNPGDDVPGWEDADCTEPHPGSTYVFTYPNVYSVQAAVLDGLGAAGPHLVDLRLRDCDNFPCTADTFDLTVPYVLAVLDGTRGDDGLPHGSGAWGPDAAGNRQVTASGRSMLIDWSNDGSLRAIASVTVCIEQMRPDGVRGAVRAAVAAKNYPYVSTPVSDTFVYRFPFDILLSDHAGYDATRPDSPADKPEGFDTAHYTYEQSYDAAWPWDDITDPSIREQIQARYTPYNAL